MKNSEKIIKYLVDNQATVNDISEHIGISRQAVHRILNRLIENNEIVKSGKPPKVYYSIPKSEDQAFLMKTKALAVNKETKNIIDKNFLYITPLGEMLTGWEGFSRWCVESDQDVIKMSKIYLKTIKKYEKHKKDGLIDGMSKMEATFKEVALDQVFYLDFYAIEIFGKTKLGQLLLFAKQSQDPILMNQMIDSIKPSVLRIVKKFNIDGVVYIPPTVKRERQLMKQIQKRLQLDIRTIPVEKIKTPVAVPQKTLSKLEDRIVNADKTIVVDGKGQYNNILLLDDAVGSGATLNETAKKIRQKNICKGKIIGLAIIGSVKGFDVISEV